MDAVTHFEGPSSPPRPMHGHSGSLSEFRPQSGHGAMAVPNRPPGLKAAPFAGHTRNASSISGANGLARSPPNKNTTHVPCKFFRQGNCQAGSACPFDHSMEPEPPCKYFMKGNCKFGAKCALAHILPDGRRVNRPPGGYNQGAGHQGPRSQGFYPGPQMDTLPGPQQTFAHQYASQDELYSQHLRSRQTEQAIDPAYGSPSGSKFGSPPNESRLAPTSPSLNGLSALDTPFPASFDSTSISLVAQHHKKFGESVPTSFGWGPLTSPSPPTTSTANHQAFGNLNSLARGQQDLRGQQQYGSSPPGQQFAMSPHLGPADTQPRRILHSERRTTPQHISASMGARPVLGEYMLDKTQEEPDDDDDDQLAFEEDLVPHSLSELLTPAEKMRRFSRTEGGDSLGSRPPLSAFGSPPDSKVGSPAHNSPSRYGALFARQRKDEQEGPNTSPFGHVGSPLRNASFGGKIAEVGNTSSLGAIGRPQRSGDSSPYMSSPPRTGGIGLISEQLRKTRISPGPRPEGDESSGALRSASAPFRNISGPSTGSLGSLGRNDRTISSSSIGRGRIDEEPCVFDMEDDEEEKEKRKEISEADKTSKRWAEIVAGKDIEPPTLNGTEKTA